MRIAHYMQNIDFTRGGPPRAVVDQVATMFARGHTTGLLTTDVTDVPAAWLDPANAGSTPMVEHLPAVRGSFGRFGREAIDRLATMISDYDVIHVHGVWETILRVTAEEAARAGKPYLFTAHGMLGENHLKTKGWKKRIAIALKYRRLFNGAAALHMGNDVEAELSTILGLQPPMLVCPNGISFEEIEPLSEKGTFRAKFPEVGARPFILFLSRLHQVKGLDYLADAFKIFCESDEETDLVVAGPDGGMQEIFEAAISALGYTVTPATAG